MKKQLKWNEMNFPPFFSPIFLFKWKAACRTSYGGLENVKKRASIHFTVLQTRFSVNLRTFEKTFWPIITTNLPRKLPNYAGTFVFLPSSWKKQKNPTKGLFLWPQTNSAIHTVYIMWSIAETWPADNLITADSDVPQEKSVNELNPP